MSTKFHTSIWARMKIVLQSFFIFHFSFLTLQSCGVDVEDSTPPSPPVWVQKTLPEQWPERGVDAHESGAIYLEWEPNPENNIYAYLIYRSEMLGETQQDYELISKILVENNAEVNYLDLDVVSQLIYHYKLKAENSSDIRSNYSDSIEYSLLTAISRASMNPNGSADTLGEDRLLSWTSYLSYQLEDYCLTILNQSNEVLTREAFLPEDYSGSIGYWQIPSEVLLENGQIYYWRIDTGAKYIEGVETAASESKWAKFFFTDES
jgi:hypothetical protein